MHWRPRGRFIGDIIPFFWKGKYHLFYLPRAEGHRHPWGHIVSSDLVHWEELPDPLQPEPTGAPDAGGCWTGSVIEHGGTFHIFYTGWNPESRYPQTICHATSQDLIHWEKDPENPILLPDERWYEGQDFRDPFVFHNPEVDEFWMLICARDRRVPFARRGCVALATSPDLGRWELREPLWSGSVCWAAECPDMFRLDNRWYLVYSHGTTRYRFAESSTGPWLAASPDAFDSHFVSAAKSLNDGWRQILFGWVPTLEGERDGGGRVWGGHMAAPRELVPLADGSLAVRLPREIAAEGDAASEVNPLEGTCEPLCGRWEVADGRAVGEAVGGVAVLKFPGVPRDFILSLSVLPRGPAAEFGFLLRMTEAGDDGRKAVVERAWSRLALYRWNAWGDPEPVISRPLRVAEGEPVKVHLILHGSILELFAAERVSLAARLYDPPAGWLGLYVANGSAEFFDLRLRPLEPLS